MNKGESSWLQASLIKNPNIETIINEHLQELLDLIRSKYISHGTEIKPVDLARKIQYFLLDSISAISLGKAFGNLKSDTDIDGCIKAIEEALALWATSLALGIGWLPQVPLIGWLFLPSLKDKEGFGKFMSKCFSYVDKRAASVTDKDTDMLASFIRNGVVGDDLRSEALIFMTVGPVNPLGAISGTILHIITNPRVYTKLQNEIDSAVRDGKAPPARGGLISSTQAKQLPYLQATIRESMRICPPVDGLFAREVPPGGDTVVVDGKPMFLPGGTSIARSAVAMYRDKAIFGDDADYYRPERWFPQDADKLAEMTSVIETVYNRGKSQCLGKAIAEVEIGKTIFELLRNFELTLVKPARPWKRVNVLGLFIISDMWVKVTERTASD
ncbi:cytochrome P450 [Arthroderma uncinatum]|uniref:cytochrome P450 n=1 Tax=Arthroderma uncinatum TaxID=74035 RepID=UPI00144A9ECF|nr:cytochrome P450 [Arthroderma uncinatum]KAF3480559.1 cytochrome P450 [Arthroderma uncinatum]